MAFCAAADDGTMAMGSKGNWAIHLSAGAFVAVATVAAFNLFLPFNKEHGSGDTPAQVLNRNGYLEIWPATNLGGPGIIVTVDLRTDNFAMIHPTCNMDWTEVSRLWESSPSVDTNIARELRGEFKVGADILKHVGLDIGSNVINEIDMTFENTKVIVLTDEARFGLQAKYLKGDCLNAVLRITSVNKQCVTQPISALQADIHYRVKFSDNIDASEKDKILGKVSGALATDGSTDRSDSIIGKSLFVGLKLDAWCIVPNNGELGKSIASVATTNVSAVVDHPPSPLLRSE
jgi:hypothetical protein